ncbi:hypothetical protein BU16DRAFT_582254 [Lophium mytilinum]|uniref:Uncharacterized protein n=1 Tax=Lophium mytilinum TaxID=390894 RepID=A0A6A6QV69_9PEZI|nr:hypothetical protein BU16DRAFT_582254 [Lophium mytilinum]
MGRRAARRERESPGFARSRRSQEPTSCTVLPQPGRPLPWPVGARGAALSRAVDVGCAPVQDQTLEAIESGRGPGTALGLTSGARFGSGTAAGSVRLRGPAVTPLLIGALAPSCLLCCCTSYHFTTWMAPSACLNHRATRGCQTRNAEALPSLACDDAQFDLSAVPSRCDPANHALGPRQPAGLIDEIEDKDERGEADAWRRWTSDCILCRQYDPMDSVALIIRVLRRTRLLTSMRRPRHHALVAGMQGLLRSHSDGDGYIKLRSALPSYEYCVHKPRPRPNRPTFQELCICPRVEIYCVLRRAETHIYDVAVMTPNSSSSRKLAPRPQVTARTRTQTYKEVLRGISCQANPIVKYRGTGLTIDYCEYRSGR